MNYIDIIIVFIFTSSILFGLSNGFVKEAASLAALVLGIWGAVKFSAFTALKLYDFFDVSGRYTGIAAFIITFGLIVIAVHFIGIVVDKFVKFTALGFLNRIFGAIFGLLRSALLLSVVFFILNAIDVRKPFLPKQKVKQSVLYNNIADIIPKLFPHIGGENLKPNIDKLKKKSGDISI